MLALLFGAVGMAFALAGARQARRRKVERQAILAPCLGALADPRPSLAPDGYPRLSGRHEGRCCRLAVVPDTLTLRRLPQLWLTIAASSTSALPSLVVTARPRGDDYISDAFDYSRQIDVPPWLPRDTMVRVGDHAVDLECLREPLATLFDDPLVKELSLGPKGFRLVYRLAEGERANHLLLRQCRFTAHVEPALLDGLISRLAAVETAMTLPLAEAA